MPPTGSRLLGNAKNRYHPSQVQRSYGESRLIGFMAMSVSPPQGSKISVTIDGPDEVIVIPQKGSGAERYLGAVFIVFWLAIWTFGFWEALRSAYVGSLQGKGGAFAVVFTFVALAFMAFGEAVGITHLYRLLRPAVPETLRLRVDGVNYDSGVPPFRIKAGYNNYPDFWRSLFPRRLRLELSRQQVRSVRLRETDSGNRLTYDLGPSRIDIASGASEIEREWLAKVLLARYK